MSEFPTAPPPPSHDPQEPSEKSHERVVDIPDQFTVPGKIKIKLPEEDQPDQ